MGSNQNPGRGAATTEVIVVIGAGSIGQAIARRVSAGKHIVLADNRFIFLRRTRSTVNAAHVHAAPRHSPGL